jgi:hypothetical protein
MPYGFKHRWKDEVGSATPQFLDNRTIVVSPDNMVDHTGHHSGDTLTFFDVTTGSLLREVKPVFFGPTAELAVSPDRRYFATVSAYASPKVTRADGRLPNSHIPEVLVYQSAGTPLPAVIPTEPGLIGGVAQLNQLLLPSLSADAATLAIAQDGRVVVFERKN